MSENVKESGKYESYVGEKEELPAEASLADFLPEEDLDDGENKAFWEKHWKGMPEYKQEENPAYHQIKISFRTEEDYKEFAKLVDQNLTIKTKSIWHPKLDRVANSLMRWIED
tara:strand:+ start:299 stop:637 length:339 start_codon:yes stop_codon:yes gene_type:complete